MVLWCFTFPRSAVFRCFGVHFPRTARCFGVLVFWCFTFVDGWCFGVSLSAWTHGVNSGLFSRHPRRRQNGECHRHRSPPSSLVCVVRGGPGWYLPVGWARMVHVDCIPHVRDTAPASSLPHGCCNCYSLLPPLGCMGCSLRLATPIPTLPGRALGIPARNPKTW